MIDECSFMSGTPEPLTSGPPPLHAQPAKFGELIAAGRNRDVPVVVPTQFVLIGDEVLVHLLRPNPIWMAIAENPNVLLVRVG